MKEIWKDIPGYEDLYQVSNLGNVRSLHWNNSNVIRLLTPFDNNGYLRIGFRVNRKLKNHMVHVLVAKVFVPNPLDKPCVNHIDGNKLNNRSDNLEWVSVSENIRHAIKHNLRTTNCCRWRPRKVCLYTLDGTFIKSFPSQREASRQLHLSQSNISTAVKKQKPYAKFLWKDY